MKGICPICKSKNACAFTTGEDPTTCWCMTIKVPKALLEQIPPEKRGQSCVCKSCIIAYKNAHSEE